MAANVTAALQTVQPVQLQYEDRSSTLQQQSSPRVWTTIDRSMLSEHSRARYRHANRLLSARKINGAIIT